MYFNKLNSKKKKEKVKFLSYIIFKFTKFKVDLKNDFLIS